MSTATPEATTELKPLVFQDEMHKTQFDMLSGFIEKRNDLVGKANAANGDRQTLTEQIRDKSVDPDIVQLREAIAQAILDLDALVKPQVDEIIANSEGSKAEIEEEIKKLDSVLKPGLTFFKKIYEDDSDKHFPKQERLAGVGVRTGAGGRRIRGFHVEITVDGEVNAYESFSAAAKYLDVETSELQAAFFSKGGSEDSKKIADEVSVVLNLEVVDEDGNKEEKEALVKFFRTEDEKARLKDVADKAAAKAQEAAAAAGAVVSTDAGDGGSDDVSGSAAEVDPEAI